MFDATNPRERLVYHVQELERLQELKQQAADDLKAGFDAAKADGYDTATLRVVLKLRKMTPDQRRERRALEAIYMANLGMLDGDALPDSARQRYEPPAPPEDSTDRKDSRDQDEPDTAVHQAKPPAAPAPRPGQQPLVLKDPAEARVEGEAAAAAGKRIYDNPYPAGDPCRAAWDEGWCAARKSNGMETPEAFRRRDDKPPKPPNDAATDDAKKGAA